MVQEGSYNFEDNFVGLAEEGSHCMADCQLAEQGVYFVLGY
jgi:hypothetical protein